MNEEVKKELENIYNNDQEARIIWKRLEKEYGSNSKEVKKHLENIKKLQKKNQIVVEKILNKYGWLSKREIGHKAYQAIWLVIQHTDEKDIIKYYNEVEKAFKEGIISKVDYAMFYDRFLLVQGKKQIYGTQFIYDENIKKYVLDKVEDFPNLDKRRKDIGLPPVEEDLKALNNKE